MRILQLIQKPQLRGAEIFANQLSTHLKEAGHDVLMISLLAGNAKLPFTGKHISLERPLSRRFIDLQGWRLFARHIKEFKPDLIQANAGDTLKFAVFSKLFFRWTVPIVFRNANKVSSFINTTPKRLFNKFLVRNISHVISVSELCRVDFVKTYSFSSSRISTIPIGLDALPMKNTLPDDLQSFFSSGKVIVHVASFVPEKNHHGLLLIVQRLLALGEDVKVVCIGDGKLRSGIEQRIAELKLADRVFLAGYRSDVLSIVAHAHALVLPSIIEGLPGVILEAMYCRTPVVAYDVGGISEVVRNGETGWLVRAQDEDEFVSAMMEVLAIDKEVLKRITDRAYQLVVSEFDNRVIARRFLEAYKKVMN